MEKIVGVIFVELTRFGPERLDDSNRHLCVFGKYRKVAETRRLAAIEIFDARIDTKADRLAPLGFVLRVEDERPILRQSALEPRNGVTKRLAVGDSAAYPTIGDTQHLRPVS